MIVESTHYWARAGQLEAVLAQRRRATALRLRLGLAPGRMHRRREGDGPDVRWECEFPSEDEYRRDLAVRAASPEFAATRQAMHALLERFERHVEESVEDLSPR
jgi:hypothetical protein